MVNKILGGWLVGRGGNLWLSRLGVERLVGVFMFGSRIQ